MMSKKQSAEKTVRDIRRATRRQYSAEEKIRIAQNRCGVTIRVIFISESLRLAEDCLLANEYKRLLTRKLAFNLNVSAATCDPIQS